MDKHARIGALVEEIRKQKKIDVLLLVEELKRHGKLDIVERYQRFITGELPLSRDELTRVLLKLGLDKDERDTILEPYNFSEAFHRYINRSKIQRSELAGAADRQPGWISKLAHGKIFPTDPVAIRKVTRLLPLTKPERVELERLTGLDFSTLSDPLPVPESESLTRLLNEVKVGLGGQRKFSRVNPTKPLSLPYGQVVGAEELLSLTKRLLCNVAFQADRPELRLAFGRQFSEQQVSSLLPSLRIALAEGCSVRQLLPSDDTAAEAIQRITTTLELLGFEGTYNVRSVRQDERFPPQRGLHTTEGVGIFFLPPHSGEITRGYIFETTPKYFTDYFDSVYDASHPKLEVFGPGVSGHIELEKALLIEEQRSTGRLLFKRGINSLMVPEEQWDWELEYKLRKFGLWGNEDADAKRWESLKALKIRRLENLQVLLLNYPCLDYCSAHALKQFLLHDNPLMEDNRRTRAARRACIAMVLAWLENYDHYHLALAEQADFDSVFFEVACDSGVILEVQHSDRSSHHLAVHSPSVVSAFRRYFLEAWHDLPPRMKDKQRVSEQLRAWHDEIRD